MTDVPKTPKPVKEPLPEKGKPEKPQDKVAPGPGADGAVPKVG